MDARPYKLFGAAERAHVEEFVGGAVKAWREAWVPAGLRLRTECAPACEFARRFAEGGALEWQAFAAGEARWTMAAARGAIGGVAAALCGLADGKARPGYSGESELASEAARSALRELAAGLLGAPTATVLPQEESAPPPAHTWEKGSASIALVLALGDTTLRFVSSPGWVLRLLRERLSRASPAAAPAARLESRRSAVADREVSLQVVAGWVELELGVLRGLTPGNVIALGTRIDTPLSVVGSGRSAPLFRGRLGAAQGRRAVAVTGAR
jgi:flagellar motor switch/type III secretory pathway protein FliN